MATIDLTTISAAIQAEIDVISSNDPIRAAEASIRLAEWQAAHGAYAAEIDRNISSYSLASRSVQHKATTDLKTVADGCYKALLETIRGGISLIDQGNFYDYDVT